MGRCLIINAIERLYLGSQRSDLETLKKKNQEKRKQKLTRHTKDHGRKTAENAAGAAEIQRAPTCTKKYSECMDATVGLY